MGDLKAGLFLDYCLKEIGGQFTRVVPNEVPLPTIETT